MFEFIRNFFDRQMFGAVRSKDWGQVRNAHLRAKPNCEICGKTRVGFRTCEVHHIRPFHIQPELELEPSNLITLCRDHHLLFGHLLNWKSFNANIAQDAKVWREKIINRPKL